MVAVRSRGHSSDDSLRGLCKDKVAIKTLANIFTIKELVVVRFKSGLKYLLSVLIIDTINQMHQACKTPQTTQVNDQATTILPLWRPCKTPRQLDYV